MPWCCLGLMVFICFLIGFYGAYQGFVVFYGVDLFLFFDFMVFIGFHFMVQVTLELQ